MQMKQDQVRKIIRFFKQGMSVKTSSSNVFLKAPNIFKIQYQTFNTNGDLIDHFIPLSISLKTCALKSCDVQYTPDGTYMTYDDPFRTMTSYQLSSYHSVNLILYMMSDYTELDQDRRPSNRILKCQLISVTSQILNMSVVMLTRNNISEYQKVKNLFRRGKLKNDIFNDLTYFTKVSNCW